MIGFNPLAKSSYMHLLFHHDVVSDVNNWITAITGSKIQRVVYYQCCVLIGWATTRQYVIAH